MKKLKKRVATFLFISLILFSGIGCFGKKVKVNKITTNADGVYVELQYKDTIIETVIPIEKEESK